MRRLLTLAFLVMALLAVPSFAQTPALDTYKAEQAIKKLVSQYQADEPARQRALAIERGKAFAEQLEEKRDNQTKMSLLFVGGIIGVIAILMLVGWMMPKIKLATEEAAIGTVVAAVKGKRAVAGHLEGFKKKVRSRLDENP